jgi:serine/threonine protein kinase
LPFVVRDCPPGAALSAGATWRPEDVTRLARAIARVMARAHDAGIVFRNLCPARVWWDGDGAHLLPPSLTRHDADERVTHCSQWVGIAAYAAPEQRMGLEATPASDVFALGCILKELMDAGRTASSLSDAPDGPGSSALRAIVERMRHLAPPLRPSAAELTTL